MSEAHHYTAHADDGVRIALHRLAPVQPGGWPPVLLVPGTFSTRTFWIGTRGHGFGPVLAAAGFDVWVLEPRGHGESERPPRWTFDDWIQRDAPAALARVRGETGHEGCFWVGHSAGGVVGAAFAGLDRPESRLLRGLVLIGSPGPGTLRGPRRWLARAAHAGVSLLPHLHWPGEPFGLGPENEPSALVRQWLRWNVDGVWRRPDGGDYLAGLAAARLPVLAVAGAGDRLLAPPHSVTDLAGRFGSEQVELLVAGRETGFSHDYGHADLVVGRPAREEIWPRVLAWLRARVAEPAPHAPARAQQRHGPRVGD